MGGKLETLVWSLAAVLQVTAAIPHQGVRTGRSAACREDTEFLHSGVCCLKCEAGQYVKTPCSEAGQKGRCERCEDGTFTEHANGLKQCIKCTQCHPDQEPVTACTPTQNTVCQCKPGRYCHPDEACEICKKCGSCKQDEQVMKNCTSTSNTECKKIQSRSASDAVPGLAVGLPAVSIALVAVALIFIWKKRRGRADSSSLKPNCLPVTPEPSSAAALNKLRVQPKISPQSNEETQRLCGSGKSSASSSQHSLTDPLCCTPPAATLSWEEPIRREDESFPILVPVDGVESLKKCIEFFEEVNVDFHKRFFRQLSLNDNMIKSRDQVPYEDRMHDLLNHWVEKRGKEASLNELLRALLELNQRRTAETIMHRAVQSGYYQYNSSSLEL